MPSNEIEELMINDDYNGFVRAVNETSVEDLSDEYFDYTRFMEKVNETPTENLDKVQGTQTTLVMKAFEKDPKYLSVLLDKGVKANKRKLLLQAAKQQNFKMMQVLLDHKARTNELDNYLAFSAGPQKRHIQKFLDDYIKDLIFKPGCLSAYKIKKFLGEGSSGKVYNVCRLDENCEYVIKIIDLLDTKPENLKDLETIKQDIKNDLSKGQDDRTKYSSQYLYEFLKEQYLSELFSAQNIGPKYYGYIICDIKSFGYKGILIYEKWSREMEKQRLEI